MDSKTDENKIIIDLDKNCTQCGNPGAAGNGLCLTCIAAAADPPPAPMDATPASGGDSTDDIRRQVQERVEKEAAEKQPDEKEEKITSKFIKECLNKNELGDALLYAELFRNKFVYNKGTNEWLSWDGHYWKIDIMTKYIASVEQVALLYAEETKKTFAHIGEKISKGADPKSEEIEKLQSHAKELSKRVYGLRSAGKRRAACCEMAHSMSEPMAVPAENFNLKTMRYPCGNGVIDLKTGKLHPGKPEDYFSLGSRIDFIGIDDPPELWERTLLEIYNDTEIVAYLQRLFGYAMTGLSHLKVFPIFYGKHGWNGRSVILETIKNIMGTMAGPIPSEMLLSQKFAKSASGPSPDVMKLKGLRFAIASETDQNQRFSTSKIKWFTGRNELTGRWPNDKRNIDFMPMFVMVLESNFKPSAPPRDYSFWERVHLIPHNITFVDREPRETWERRANGDLKEQLEAEYPKILGWLVRGCLLWQKDGLNPPDIILEESKKYKQGEDIIGDFIEECCIKEPFAEVSASELYNRFVEWYHANHGQKEPNSTIFGKEITQEFDKSRKSGRVVYHGIRLADMMGSASET